MVWTYFRLTLCSQILVQMFIICLSEIAKDTMIIPKNLPLLVFRRISPSFSDSSFLLNPKGWERIWSCLIEYVTKTGGAILHLKHHRAPGHQIGLTTHTSVFPSARPTPNSRTPLSGWKPVLQISHELFHSSSFLHSNCSYCIKHRETGQNSEHTLKAVS